MLFELAENLIDDHGFHPTLFPPAVNSTDSTGYYSERHLQESNKKVPAHGNTLAIQLVVDAMKLQPCRPSFQAARDAILTVRFDSFSPLIAAALLQVECFLTLPACFRRLTRSSLMERTAARSGSRSPSEVSDPIRGLSVRLLGCVIIFSRDHLP